MNKEQSNQMFGVDNINAWLDYISCSHSFALGGKAMIATSLLSDVQEILAIDTYDTYETARRAINRIKFLHDLEPGQELERRIVGKLMRYLRSRGFEVVAVNDQGERYDTDDPAVAMGHIFAVDQASLRVRSQAGNVGCEHGILLVPGNGEDIIADYSYSEGDTDGFENAMKNFTPPKDPA